MVAVSEGKPVGETAGNQELPFCEKGTETNRLGPRAGLSSGFCCAGAGGPQPGSRSLWSPWGRAEVGGWGRVARREGAPPGRPAVSWPVRLHRLPVCPRLACRVPTLVIPKTPVFTPTSAQLLVAWPSEPGKGRRNSAQGFDCIHRPSSINPHKNPGQCVELF